MGFPASSIFFWRSSYTSVDFQRLEVGFSLVDDFCFLCLYGKATAYRTKSKMEKRGLFISAVSFFVFVVVFFVVFWHTCWFSALAAEFGVCFACVCKVKAMVAAKAAKLSESEYNIFVGLLSTVSDDFFYRFVEFQRLHLKLKLWFSFKCKVNARVRGKQAEWKYGGFSLLPP